MPVCEIGNLSLEDIVNGQQETVSVKEILSVPDIPTNLSSVSQITHHDNEVNFDNKDCRNFHD